MQKIIHGDQAELFKDIKDNSVKAIITDPPYNLLKGHKIETAFNFDLFLKNCYRVLKDDGFLVYFCQEPTATQWNYKAMQVLKYKAEVIWYKIQISNPFIYPCRTHEKIMFFTKKNGKFNKPKITWKADIEEYLPFYTKQTFVRKISSIFTRINRAKSLDDLKTILVHDVSKANDKIYDTYKGGTKEQFSKLISNYSIKTMWVSPPHNKQKFNNVTNNIKHPTVKPLNIITRQIEMCSKEEDLILDPFLGSGTTAIACKQSNREFIGFEIHQEYIDISKNRLSEILI